MCNRQKAHFKQCMGCVSLWMKHLSTSEEGVFLFVYGCCQKQIVFSGMLKSNVPPEHFRDPHLLTYLQKKDNLLKHSDSCSLCVHGVCRASVSCRRQPNNIQAKLTRSKSPAGWRFGINRRWSDDKSMQATHMLVYGKKNKTAFVCFST